MTVVFLILALLQFKHWLVDFVFQTDEEIRHKGVYLNWRGMQHSVKHAVATSAVLMLCDVDWPIAYALGLLDLVAHYHIDWIKIRWGNSDMRNPQFWNHLGLDQMAHQLCYLCYVWIVIS